MNTIVKYDGAFGALRVVKDNGGEPWFVAKDVCDALGLSNVGQAIIGLDRDEKNSISIDDGNRGNPKKAIVSEAGLYSLIMRSRKPEAKAFKRWVTHEVLPSIRKDGGYMVPRVDETPEETMARALLIADKALETKDKRIAELEPKARFADAVADTDGTCLIADLAKILTQNGFEIGQNRLFERLRRDGYLGNVGGHRNVPTQRAMEMGLFRIKETTFISANGKVRATRTPKVTGKGQAYFVDHYCGVRA